MKLDSVDTNDAIWQESLDPKLTRRLMRQSAQPGVVGTHLVESILLRMQAMTDRSPLAEQLGQRQHWVAQRSADAVPIVYARPRGDRLGQNVSAADLQPSVRKPSGPVIQAKLARPQQESLVDFSQPPLYTQKEGDYSTREQSAGQSGKKPSVPVIQAKLARPQQELSLADISRPPRPPQDTQKEGDYSTREQSLADISRPPLDKQTDPDSITRELSNLPKVRAKLAIQPVENVVKTLGKDARNGEIGRTPATGSVTQNATGQKSVVRAKNRNPSPKSLVVQRKLARPVVRENKLPPVGRSPVPLVFASSTNNEPPRRNGRGMAGNRPVSSDNTVVQRFPNSHNNYQSRRNGRGRTGILPANHQIGNNAVIQRLPYSDSFSASPDEIVQRSPATDLDSDDRPAESTELGNEVNVDVEELVDIVQRRLMLRLTIETERRGLRGLTRWLKI